MHTREMPQRVLERHVGHPHMDLVAYGAVAGEGAQDVARGGLAQDVEYVAGGLVEPEGEYRLTAREAEVSRPAPQGPRRGRSGDPRRQAGSAVLRPLARWRRTYPPMELGRRRVGGGRRGMVGVVET